MKRTGGEGASFSEAVILRSPRGNEDPRHLEDNIIVAELPGLLHQEVNVQLERI